MITSRIGKASYFTFAPYCRFSLILSHPTVIVKLKLYIIVHIIRSAVVWSVVHAAPVVNNECFTEQTYSCTSSIQTILLLHKIS